MKTDLKAIAIFSMLLIAFLCSCTSVHDTVHSSDFWTFSWKDPSYKASTPQILLSENGVATDSYSITHHIAKSWIIGLGSKVALAFVQIDPNGLFWASVSLVEDDSTNEWYGSSSISSSRPLIHSSNTPLNKEVIPIPEAGFGSIISTSKAFPENTTKLWIEPHYIYVASVYQVIMQPPANASDVQSSTSGVVKYALDRFTVVVDYASSGKSMFFFGDDSPSHVSSLAIQAFNKWTQLLAVPAKPTSSS